jgi:hypothetical protein
MTKLSGKKPAMKHLAQKNKKEGPAPHDPHADVFSFRERWLILGFIMLLLVFARARLLDVPLERDEGEYAYMGQLLLHGVPPYSAAYNMKFPGTYLMYALNMSLFGQTIQGIHLGLLAVNCLTVLLLFFLCKKLANDFAAIIASGAYAVLSLSSSVFGFAAHATHFVILPALAGSLFLLSAVEKNRARLFFLSGTLFGLAFLMKQPGIFFIAFGASYLAYRYWSARSGQLLKIQALNLSLFLFGALLPLLLTFLWLYTAGVFGKFWFWAVQYAAKYGAQVPLSEAFDYFKIGFRTVTNGFWLLWIVSGLGLLVALFHRELKDSRLFIVLFSIFSFLSIVPGFYFREHYFITLLPAISIAIGIFFNYLCTKSGAFLKAPQSRFIVLGIFIAVVLAGIVNQQGYFIKDDPVAVSRKMYGANPFPESIEIARFIEARTTPSDRIAVFGSEPQIYFYSKRRSATGHIYTYGLMEQHAFALSMQEEMAREIEASRPKFIVDVHVPTSWLLRPESEKYIFEWFVNFLKKSYVPAGIVDINTSGGTVYKWHDDIKNYTIQSPSYVLIYERL